MAVRRRLFVASGEGIRDSINTPWLRERNSHFFL
jgi:hypothetical protein